MLKLIDVIESKTSRTFKYVFETHDTSILEFSYIDKEDGKDIICVPSQTMCNIGCKFCHTTEYLGKIKARNLFYYEILEGVKYIIEQRKLYKKNKTLLVSYMGIGEPIMNTLSVLDSMKEIYYSYWHIYKTVRFALATCMPQHYRLEFADFVDEVKTSRLNIKLHLSLHYTNDKIRKEWMPQALPILPSLYMVNHYKNYTGNPVEIHYTLIDGINDTEEDALLLSKYLKDRGMVVKFLAFNEKPTLNVHASNVEKIDMFTKILEDNKIAYEHYTPPGLDIGASCGQFMMDKYVEI